MKAIIDGRTYNTETADLICQSSYADGGDFRWHETGLYRTKKGAFFLAGSGGPMSEWAVPDGNGASSGSGIRLVDRREARERMERARCPEALFKTCGFELTEG